MLATYFVPFYGGRKWFAIVVWVKDRFRIILLQQHASLKEYQRAWSNRMIAFDCCKLFSKDCAAGTSAGGRGDTKASGNPRVARLCTAACCMQFRLLYYNLDNKLKSAYTRLAYFPNTFWV